MFKDRREAGRLLAEKISATADAVVYALPRGGLVLGEILAARLHCPLEAFIVKKIGHPFQPEYAIGAVAETGAQLLDPFEAQSLDAAWLDKAIRQALTIAKQRRQHYSPSHPFISARHKTAIVVDDGIATGLTMRLALTEIKRLQPRRLICAVPVLPSTVYHHLTAIADQVVFLDQPSFFQPAVGNYYQDFSQVSDEEAIAILNRAGQ